METESYPPNISPQGTTTGQPVTYDPLTQQPTKRSSLPMIAGIMLIVAGLLGLLFCAAIFFVDPAMIEETLAQQPTFEITNTQIYSILIICGAIGSVLSIFTILGGIFALKRKMWWFALLSGILGLFIIGLPPFISTVLSFIGLILIVISKKDFQ